MTETATWPWWRWAVEPLRKYAVFRGRARRREFWFFALLLFIIDLVALAGGSRVDDRREYLSEENYLELSSDILLFLPSLAVFVRRLHDIGRSARYFFASFLTILLVGLLLFWSILKLINSSAPLITIAVQLLPLFIVLSVFGYPAYVMTKGGSPGANRYGPDPKHPKAAHLADIFA